MADVLLVHVREDETLADGIGISLERSGLTVARGESVFDVGDEVPCVIVLWSDVSTRSSMVRDVAIRAQREGKLVAATLGGCETPLGFARPVPQDLSEWGGDPDDPCLDPLFFAADRLVCAARLGEPVRRTQSQPYAQRPAPAPRAPTPQQRPQDTRADRPTHDQRFEQRELPETPLPAQRIYQPAQAPAPEAAPPAPSAQAATRDMPPNLAAETLAWKQIENSKDPEEFLAYLGHYGPKGLFSELASMKLDKLTHKPKDNAKPGAFIAHKATPHTAKPKAPEPKRPEPRRPEPVREARVEPLRQPARALERAPERPAPRGDQRVEPRTEQRRAEARAAEGYGEPRSPEARRPEPRPEQRVEPRATPRPEPRLSEISRGDDRDAPPRTRVSAAARRRPQQVQTRHIAHEEQRGGFPWGALAAIVILGAGGFAAYQNMPKSPAEAASSPPGFAEALRAAPAAEGDRVETADASDTRALEATSFSDAAAPAKRDAVKKPPQRVAEATPARRDGVGGPVVPIAPRDNGGGDTTPAPVVAFRPVTPTTPTPVVAPPPAAPQPAESAAAFDASSGAAPVRYVQPQWIKQPSGQVLARFYPSAALDAGRSGIAVLDCAILQSGKLNCVVQSETPKGQGFGAGALQASAIYLASPQAADGTMAYGNRTRLTIAFR